MRPSHIAIILDREFEAESRKFFDEVRRVEIAIGALALAKRDMDVYARAFLHSKIISRAISS